MSEPVGVVDPRFSEPDAVAPAWSEVAAVLTTSEMFWLATVRGDGRPHLVPLPAIWHDGALHVCTGAREQKAVNLAAEPRCALSTGTATMNAGLDVAVEGSAARVRDAEMLRRLAELWKAKLEWEFHVTDEGFHDPEGGDALVFRITPEKVLAFAKGDAFSQTRYRL